MMCRRCQPNHKIDVPMCIVVVGWTVGFGWAIAHSYEGQPFIEGFIPILITTAVFAAIGVPIGIIISRWGRQQ